MKKTALTTATLDRFEAEYNTTGYTTAEVDAIEYAAYAANMNECKHPEWSENDVYNDFLRILGAHGVKLVKSAENVLAAAADLLAAEKTRSAWSNGVKAYAAELLEELAENAPDVIAEGSRSDLLTAMLNGAMDWTQYSEGGCSLIYNGEIAARLCTPSELKKTRNGERRPNSHEQWLDVQARALYQAAERVVKAIEQARKDV